MTSYSTHSLCCSVCAAVCVQQGYLHDGMILNALSPPSGEMHTSPRIHCGQTENKPLMGNQEEKSNTVSRGCNDSILIIMLVIFIQLGSLSDHLRTRNHRSSSQSPFFETASLGKGKSFAFHVDRAQLDHGTSECSQQDDTLDLLQAPLKRWKCQSDSRLAP